MYNNKENWVFLETNRSNVISSVSSLLNSQINKERKIKLISSVSVENYDNPNISYGLECELTCDGYNKPKYGDAFTVDRLPSRMRENAYFIVTKIGQEFGGGDWTTKLSGLMMIDA